jgi:tyrosine-specific transport protein
LLLFAGTAVGAGAVVVPVETADAGFVPSALGLLLCWVYTCVTSLVMLAASWLLSSSASAALSVRGDDEDGGGGGGTGFLSILRMSLGPPGEAITASLFWFLLTAIIVAYTSEGSMLISQSAKGFAFAKIDPAIGLLLFATSFASLAVYGSSGVDAVNRVFVFGLIVAFVGLVGFGLPNVEVSNLMKRADWGIIYP